MFSTYSHMTPLFFNEFISPPAPKILLWIENKKINGNVYKLLAPNIFIGLVKYRYNIMVMCFKPLTWYGGRGYLFLHTTVSCSLEIENAYTGLVEVP